MGRLSFTIPAELQLPPYAAETAYVVGLDDVPWRCHVSVSDRCLTVLRSTPESGCLYIAWPTARGCFMLRTASLREQEEPYRLDIEVARGTLARVREFYAQAVWAGCSIPESIAADIGRAETHFLDALLAVRTDPQGALHAAQAAIDTSLSVTDTLIRGVVEVALAARKQFTRPLPTLLVGRLEAEPRDAQQEADFLQTFNVAAIPVYWRRLQTDSGQWQWQALDQQLHWCHQRGLRVGMGPLISPYREVLPDWLFLWQDDFDQLRQSVIEFVDQLIAHCRGRVQYWHVASAMNLPGDLQLCEEDRVKLLLSVIERVRRADSQTPMIVTFDQPWGQYLAHTDGELSPLYFAEMLVRGELGLAGVGLELQLGCWPGSGPPCDMVEVSRLLDHWSALNCPLLVVLTIPSDADQDPNAWQPKIQTVWGQYRPSLESQRYWVEQLVPLLLAQPSVHGILFNQSRDSLPHRIPHGGLWDRNERAKPALEALRKLRETWLT